MATHVKASCALALVGFTTLVGCGAKDEQVEIRASGGISSHVPTSGGSYYGSPVSGGAPAFGGRSSAGAPAFGAAGSGGATSTGGAAATAGIAGAAGLGGSAGVGGFGGVGGVGGVSAIAGAATQASGGIGISIGSEPQPAAECANLHPVSGASCDARGPEWCPVGTVRCFCVVPDSAPATWTCFDIGADLGAGGQSGGGIDLGLGGVSGVAGSINIGGSSVDSSFGFSGSFGRN